MTTLRVTDLIEVLSEMPALSPLHAIIDSDVDLFLCASGFESRVEAAAKILRRNRVSAKMACYFTYRKNEPENASMRRGLVNHLSKVSSHVSALDGDARGAKFRRNLDRVFRELGATLSEHSSEYEPLVVFDISCASTSLVLRTLPLLWERDIRLVVAYAQSATYFPSAQEFSDAATNAPSSSATKLALAEIEVQPADLEGDAADPEFMFENPGIHLDNLPDRVIVIAGFSGLRCNTALAYVDPALTIEHPNPRVSWIAGQPANKRDKWRLQAMLKVNGLLSNRKPAERVRVVSRRDYRDTLRVLEKDYNAYSLTERITVAAMGSKMQAVAVAIFCELHPDVRVVLVGPASHEGRHYSSGVRTTWGLDLGSAAQLRSALASVGQASLQE